MNRFKMNVVNCAMLGAFEGTGIDGRFALEANRKERSASSCRTASAHRALAWNGFDFLSLFWSRVRESNPPLWLGKRPFYR